MKVFQNVNPRHHQRKSILSNDNFAQRDQNKRNDLSRGQSLSVHSMSLFECSIHSYSCGKKVLRLIIETHL
jgi:hypothetical protein